MKKNIGDEWYIYIYIYINTLLFTFSCFENVRVTATYLVWDHETAEEVPEHVERGSDN